MIEKNHSFDNPLEEKKKFGETHVFTKMEESVRNMKYDQNRKKNETHKLHIYSKHTKLCKEKII